MFETTGDRNPTFGVLDKSLKSGILFLVFLDYMVESNQVSQCVGSSSGSKSPRAGHFTSDLSISSIRRLN